MQLNGFDPESRLMGKGDWKFWLVIALVVTIPYLAIYWWISR